LISIAYIKTRKFTSAGPAEQWESKMKVGKIATLGIGLAGASLVALAGAGGAHAATFGSGGDVDAYALQAELAADGHYYAAADVAKTAIDVCEARSNGISEVGLRHRLEDTFSVDLVVDMVEAQSGTTARSTW
jgi:hypothetical protein